MIDKRRIKNIIDTEKVVWQCLTCKREKIANRYDKPIECRCSIPVFVINGNLIVTKSPPTVKTHGVDGFIFDKEK